MTVPATNPEPGCVPAATLKPGHSFWPFDGDHGGTCVDVVSVGATDVDGMVTITTLVGKPIRMAWDWPVRLFTAADADMCRSLVMSEQDRIGGSR